MLLPREMASGYLLHRNSDYNRYWCFGKVVTERCLLPCLPAVMVGDSVALNRLVLSLKESNPDMMLLLLKPPVFDRPGV